MICPKCQLEQPEANEVCDNCAVIFRKIKERPVVNEASRVGEMKKERPRPLARLWKKISSAGIVTGMFSLMIVGWIQLLLIVDSGWGGRSAAEFTARSKVWETITVVLLVLSVFEKKCGRLLSFAIVVLFLICVAVQDLAIVFVGFFYYLPFISFPLLALLFTVFRRPDEQW